MSEVSFLKNYDAQIKNCFDCGLPRWGTKEYSQVFSSNRIRPNEANYVRLMMKKKAKKHMHDKHHGTYFDYIGNPHRGSGHNPQHHPGTPADRRIHISMDSPFIRRTREEEPEPMDTSEGVRTASRLLTFGDDDDFDGSYMVEEAFLQDFGMTQDDYMNATGLGVYDNALYNFVPDTDDDEADYNSSGLPPMYTPFRHQEPEESSSRSPLLPVPNDTSDEISYEQLCRSPLFFPQGAYDDVAP